MPTLTVESVPLRINRVSDLADLPAYQSEHAAGLDLHAAITGTVTIAPGAIELISCGFRMALPPGWEAQVRPRSGLAVRHGISIPNAPGTIDADYRGEVRVALINFGKTSYTIERNARIAQMVIAPVAHCAVQVVQTLDDTARALVASEAQGEELAGC